MDAQRLPFDVHVLRFDVQASDPLDFPFFAGSMLRGAFGRALRNVACMTRAPVCDGCALRTTCPFPRIFDPSRDPELGEAGASMPPPFVLLPPALSRPPATIGSIWSFGMKLFGSVSHDLPMIVEAWRRAVDRGLGSSSSRGRLVGVVHSGRDGETSIFDAEALSLLVDALPEPVRPAVPVSADLSIRLLTPLRIHSNAQRLSPSHFDVKRLLVDTLRRVRTLNALCGSDAARDIVDHWPTRAWVEEGAKAQMQADLRWVDNARRSSRQGQIIPMGGWLGQFTLTGVAPPVAAILSMAQAVGIGKQCVFGYGQIEVSK